MRGISGLVSSRTDDDVTVVVFVVVVFVIVVVVHLDLLMIR